MSGALTPLRLEHVDGTRWLLCEPFRYQSDLLQGIVVVPAGTETDLASVPWLFRRITPRSGKWNQAATLHDAAYRGQLVTADGQRIRLIKRLCDDLFLEAMLASGVNKWLARRMYRLVSAFGAKTQRP